jgi:hypothetical protein
MNNYITKVLKMQGISDVEATSATFHPPPRSQEGDFSVSKLNYDVDKK